MTFSILLKARAHSSKIVMNQQPGRCVEEITLLFSFFRRERQITGKDQVRKFIFKGTSSTEHPEATGFIPISCSALHLCPGTKKLLWSEWWQKASLQDSPSLKEHDILHSWHLKQESRQVSYTMSNNHYRLLTRCFWSNQSSKTLFFWSAHISSF